MSWLRIDDGEVLDSRIGSLTDAEYRGRHALMQLCAREYREHGLFPVRDIVHAVYSTEKGPRCLTPKGLRRLHALDLVRDQNEYADDELEALGIDWPDDDHWMRVHNWERYNPPRDKTATERKRRQRHGDVTPGHDRDTEGVSRRDDRDSHGASRVDARARSRPVPVNEPVSSEGSSVISKEGRTPSFEARPAEKNGDEKTFANTLEKPDYSQAIAGLPRPA